MNPKEGIKLNPTVFENSYIIKISSLLLKIHNHLKSNGQVNLLEESLK